MSHAMNCELSCRYVSEQYRAEFSDLLRKRSVSHQSWYPEKTPDILRHHHWIPCEMSEKLACFRNSDSGEWCKVKKVMKSGGGLLFTLHRSPLSEHLEQATEKWVQKFHTDDVSLTQIWVVLLIGHAAREICFNQSEHFPDLSCDVSSV